MLFGGRFPVETYAAVTAGSVVIATSLDERSSPHPVQQSCQRRKRRREGGGARDRSRLAATRRAEPGAAGRRRGVLRCDRQQGTRNARVSRAWSRSACGFWNRAGYRHRVRLPGARHSRRPPALARRRLRRWRPARRGHRRRLWRDRRSLGRGRTHHRVRHRGRHPDVRDPVGCPKPCAHTWTCPFGGRRAQHDPPVAARLAYWMFVTLLSWIVLRARFDTATRRRELGARCPPRSASAICEIQL